MIVNRGSRPLRLLSCTILEMNNVARHTGRIILLFGRKLPDSYPSYPSNLGSSELVRVKQFVDIVEAVAEAKSRHVTTPSAPKAARDKPRITPHKGRIGMVAVNQDARLNGGHQPLTRGRVAHQIQGLRQSWLGKVRASFWVRRSDARSPRPDLCGVLGLDVGNGSYS